MLNMRNGYFLLEVEVFYAYSVIFYTVPLELKKGYSTV